MPPGISGRPEVRPFRFFTGTWAEFRLMGSLWLLYGVVAWACIR